MCLNIRRHFSMRGQLYMSWLFVATLCLTNQWLVAQATYEGVKTPPQEISIDGVLETKAYVRGVSPNGRYIWAAYYHNQAAYVYDTELKKCIWQKSDAGREIDLKYVTNEGDIIYQKDRRTTLYISHSGGEDIVITSTDKDYPVLEVTGSSLQGDRLVGNLKNVDPLVRDSKPFVANRTAQGDYSIKVLPYPAEDALGGIPEGTSVLAISPDGKTLLGRQVNSDSYYPRLIQWTIPEGQESAVGYTFPGESLFFNLDLPKPGAQPKPSDYESDDAYEEAYDAWDNLVRAYCKKPMLDPMRWYYSPSTQRIHFATRNLVLNEETGGIDQILMPGYWDVEKQQGEILQQFKGFTATESFDDGTLLCIEEAKSFYHCSCITPSTRERVNLGVWLKERTGIPIEEIYSSDEDGEFVLGWPNISQDGKTLAFFGPNLENPYAFRGTYIQFTEPLGAHTSVQAPIINKVSPQLQMTAAGEIYVPELANHRISIYTAQGVLIEHGELSATGHYQLAKPHAGTVLFIQIIAPLTGELYSYRCLGSSTLLQSL